jgi:hypothetical protein
LCRLAELRQPQFGQRLPGNCSDAQDDTSAADHGDGMFDLVAFGVGEIVDLGLDPLMSRRTLVTTAAECQTLNLAGLLFGYRSR